MTRRHSRDIATFWSDPALHGLELLRACYVSQEFAPHAHETYAIGVVLSGALSFSYRSPSEVIPAGNIMIIHPGEVHTGKCMGGLGCAYRMLYPKAETLRDAGSHLAGNISDFPFFHNQNIRDDDTARLIRELHVALENPHTPTLEKESRLIWALSRLIARHATPRPPAVRPMADRVSVRKARLYLEGNYSRNITLDELALSVHVSPYHLLRVFKNELGLPPHAYLTQVRIGQAKRLLLKQTPIVDVALQTGFCDQSQFTRRFKQLVGTTPGRYCKISQYSTRPRRNILV